MILIGNGKVITRDLTNSFYDNGGVVVEGSHILEVGETSEMIHQYPQAEYVDVRGKLIMPGYIDNHEHMYSQFARGSSLPLEPADSFLGLLEKIWWKLDQNLLLEHTYFSGMTSYLECVRNGITFVCDHHASYGGIKGSLHRLAQAAEQVAVRTCLAYEISDRNGTQETKKAIEESMEFIEYAQKKDSSLLKAMVGLHASFTLSDETINTCMRENNGQVGYHVHVAEGQYDEAHCQETYHKSVVQRFADLGILQEQTIAAHCIHISPDDRKLLAKTNTMVVHNPQSNMGNSVGTTDVLALLKDNILTGLGTDGYTHDMTESLKTAHILQKHVYQNPANGFDEAIALLFDHNPQIASRITNECIGRLQKNAQADIIVVEYDPPTPMNSTNFNGHLMFGVTGAMTDSTMIQGKFVMKEKKILTVDEREIKRESRKCAQDLWKRIN